MMKRVLIILVNEKSYLTVQGKMKAKKMKMMVMMKEGMRVEGVFWEGDHDAFELWGLRSENDLSWPIDQRSRLTAERKKEMMKNWPTKKRMRRRKFGTERRCWYFSGIAEVWWSPIARRCSLRRGPRRR